MSTTTPRLSLYKGDAGDNYNRLNDLNNMKDTIDDLVRYDQDETLTGDWDVENASPNFTLHNTTDEDADYGRESELRWKGNQSGSEETTLGLIQIAHDGASDDEKGIFTLSLNDGSDGDAPTTVMTVDSSGKMGVLTPSPGEELDVTGTIRASTAVYSGTIDSDEVALGVNIAAAGHEGIGILYNAGIGYLKVQDGGVAWKPFNIQASTITLSGSGAGNALVVASNDRVGIGTAGPDRNLDVLSASSPQLRLTHTDGTVYAEFQADANGDLTITCSGDEVKIPEIVEHGTAANGLTTAADGFTMLTGTARAAMDIVFDITRLKQGGINDPAQTVVGVTYTLGFDAAADEEVFVHTEIPHNYADGTDILAHFHWAPSDGNAGNVTWAIEYHITRKENNEVLTEATTTDIVVDATQTLQDEHLTSGSITISGTGVLNGDYIHIRVFRDANASEGGASDTYAADANLISFDLEYMVDKFGEDEQW